nr:glycosyltransferase family 4 protein [Novosphingobium profundi]
MMVSNFHEAHGGGIERVAGQLCRVFAKAGHAVTWAACAQAGAAGANEPDKAPYRTLALDCANPLERINGLPLLLPSPRALARLRAEVRAADLVVIHDSLYLTSIAALIFARRAHVPEVLIQHISAIPFQSAALRALMRLANTLVTRPMLRAARTLVFISASVREDLLGPRPARQSQLLFNGVDTALFHPFAPDERAERMAHVRAAHGLPGDRPLALFAGRLVEKKGLPVLRALARLRPDVTFALAGTGPLDPAQWGLANVHPLGALDRATLAALYRSADALVLPSVGEGFPLVVQEAMASGLAVLCNEHSARADPDAARWIHGIEIDPAEPEASARRCAQALGVLLADPPDTTAMVAHARAAYDWEAMGAAILEAARQGTCQEN